MPIKLNAEKAGKPQAKHFGVSGYPTILFIEPDGDVVRKIGGYLPPDQFERAMKDVLATQDDWPAVKQGLKTKPNDPGLNAKAVPVLLQQEKHDMALKSIRIAEAAAYAGPEMLKAYTALGEADQRARAIQPAIQWFEKALPLAKDPYDIAHVKVSLAECYKQADRTDDARRLAREVMAMKECPTDLAKAAARIADSP